jgi:integrase/recombinase XerC
MQSAVQSFLRHLRIERNASELTLKSYADDFESFSEYLRDRHGRIPEVAELEVNLLRGYVTYLHECEYARSTIALRVEWMRRFLIFRNL